MIAGLSTSGIAGAIRTAGQARATMDTMSRQIATGQRVGSVKDDAAAWGRAQALKSDRTTWEQAKVWADVRISITDQRLALHNMMGEQLDKVVATLVAMTAPGLSGQSLAALESEVGSDFAELSRLLRQSQIEAQQPAYVSSHIANTATLNLPNGTAIYFDNPGGPASYADSASGTVFAFTYVGHGGQITVRNADGVLLVANATAARNALTYLQGSSDQWRQAVAAQAAGRESFSDWSARAVANMDRIDSAIGSLTDADLGRASAARAQAETRQQLALSTVRQAISTYGNFASGLLGNVQRTQRGILA